MTHQTAPSPEILDVKWRSARDTVGIVAIKTHRGWKAYIGVAKIEDEANGAIYIALHGAHLMPQEAYAFFPQFDPLEYKL